MNDARVSQLSVYPIKSTAGIHLNHAFVEEHGLAFDRRFVVCQPDGKQITARTHPKLAQVHAALTQTGLQLRAENMPNLAIQYAEFYSHYKEIMIWKDTVQAQHCSESYDQWFSRYLGEKCHLVFFGEHSSRLVKQRESQVAFADGYPLLLLSEASLEDLNLRSTTKHSMEQFRPNLVVKNTEAFAEDGWKRFKIGEVEFEVQNPCSRCVFTTLDQRTGEFDANKEPLSTLAKYRQGEDGNLYFGQNVVALNSGNISLYDPVEVLETRTPERYPENVNKRSQTSPDKQQWQQGEALELRCLAVKQETHDVKTFIFEAPEQTLSEYLPGQYIGFEFEVDGKPLRRNYTLSSSPTRPQRLAITVKRVLNGQVSNWLHDTLKPGMSLKAHAPDGDFHVKQSSNAKLLLLSAGSGITPMLSMMRYLSDLNIDRDIVFLHSAHSENDLIAEQELALLSQSFSHCSIRYTLTQQAPENWQGYQGRLNRGMLMDVTDLEQRAVYVCGPQTFMQSAKEQLLALGLHEDDYYEESFGHHPTTSSETKALNILFDSWDTYLQGNNQQNLLEQAEQAGLNLPYSCRGGFCGSCKVKLQSGEVEVLEDSGLTDDEKQQGYILSCSCIPKEDVCITQD
ncbi:hybrid-cluster NAD(P)-dependent oxidoreductase [Agarivorans albus]|uniref:Flavodoxin reductases (Ferredoxin-NADPH reductases) family 1 n=1 Tax=Agarivorans albus MKT 106 TaxID=1331007 RepID=R9PMD1_AGAAL|nr:hybrid-cluster NAD(P)-dependent oxidoreductase [Agarivorans albus]GAD02470.1 flavodoxin reductases (ferredoxin-NADPH reductases) family 1 [Agarivorans albus MKT 106]